ncbi:MAG: antibiotic biosynthesis monooxygenase family protein [Arenimonas sp.]
MPYTYVWEFLVAPEYRAEFEQHYGVDGTWVKLFRCGDGYIETLLLHDNANEMRYLTIDRWRSEADYLRFKTDFSDGYAGLDKACEHLTIDETFLGAFS